MMRNVIAGGVKRLLAVAAGVMLIGTLSAGPALAQDGSGGANATCTSLTNQFNTLVANRSVLINAINASPLNLILRNNLNLLDAQLTSLQNQLESALCSAIPDLPTGQPVTPYNPYVPGYNYDPCYDNGYTNLNYCTTDAYDSGYNNGYQRGVDSATPVTAPVATTQVSSVPTGGVDTGDGSY